MIENITLQDIIHEIRNVPDFPRKGIQFKDITTVLKQADHFSFLVDTISDIYYDKKISKVVCIESRGFILGGAIAAKLGAGFIPIRKPGKLPAETYSVEYSLEYGSDRIEVHKDALDTDDTVLLHDDLLATGGTALAAIQLLSSFQIKKLYMNFLCELDFLKGRQVLKNYDISSIIHL